MALPLQLPADPDDRIQLAKMHFLAGEKNRAISILSESIRHGDPHAASWLGEYYLSQARVAERAQAFPLLELAANGGSVMGMYLYGLTLTGLYADGPEVEEGLSWIRQARHYGLPYAGVFLAMVARKRGDKDGYLDHLSWALSLNFPDAMAEAAVLFSYGHWLPYDDQRGLQLLLDAADSGCGLADMVLGLMEGQTISGVLLGDCRVPSVLYQLEGLRRNERVHLMLAHEAGVEGSAYVLYRVALRDYRAAGGVGMPSSDVMAYLVASAEAGLKDAKKAVEEIQATNGWRPDRRA